MMLSLIIWSVFGLVVGIVAKLLHPGDDPVGLVPTVFIGVCGSFIGGGINWVMDLGRATFEPSGLLMSVVGGVVFCCAWRFYRLRTSDGGPRSFLTGKRA